MATGHMSYGSTNAMQSVLRQHLLFPLTTLLVDAPLSSPYLSPVLSDQLQCVSVSVRVHDQHGADGSAGRGDLRRRAQRRRRLHMRSSTRAVLTEYPHSSHTALTNFTHTCAAGRTLHSHCNSQVQQT